MDANLDKVLPFLDEPLVLHKGVGALIILTCVIPGLLFSLKYAAALDITSGINELDESLLRLLPNLYKDLEQPNIHEQLKKAAKKLFAALVKIKNFSTCGVAIYLPNENRNYLETWTRYSHPNETDESLTFFIGDEQRRDAPTGGRGVAGTSYVQRKAIVVHIYKDGDADKNIYIPSPGGKVRYRSLICVPITGRAENDILAILCL